MLKPAELFCDLCGGRIQDGEYSTTAKVPLPKSVRDEVVKALEKETPTASASGILGLIQMPADFMVPRVWEFSICTGCTTGLLPVAKIIDVIHAWMQERIEVKRRTQASMEDLESAAGR